MDEQNFLMAEKWPEILTLIIAEPRAELEQLAELGPLPKNMSI